MDETLIFLECKKCFWVDMGNTIYQKCPKCNSEEVFYKEIHPEKIKCSSCNKKGATPIFFEDNGNPESRQVLVLCQDCVREAEENMEEED